jgi:hypothetical protein
MTLSISGLEIFDGNFSKYHYEIDFCHQQNPSEFIHFILILPPGARFTKVFELLSPVHFIPFGELILLLNALVKRAPDT